MNSVNGSGKIIAAALAVCILLICFSSCGSENAMPTADTTLQEETSVKTTASPAESKPEETQSETSKDTEEKPVRCKEGYAGVYLSYTEEGLVERERYLDVNGLMISLADGTAWVEYEYDGVHLTVDSYKKVAEAVYRKLKQLYVK